MATVTGRAENAEQAGVLRLLRERGAISRVELAELLSLPRARLALVVDRLIHRGLAQNGGAAASRGGRPSSLVRLSDRLHFVGIDIGATSLTVAVTDGHLSVLGSASEPADVRTGPGTVLAAAAALVDKLQAELGIDAFDGAGVGVPGPVSFPQGLPSAPPLMPGWDRFPVQDVLAARLRTSVLLDNDVNIMALGERQAGVAREAPDFLFVKVGTGIGCGIVLGGQVHRGMSGSAGDIGHIQVADGGPVCACGKRGCLEAYFGGAALSRMALDAARSGRSPWLSERLQATGRLTAVDVGSAASGGDPVALELIREGAGRLGQVLAGLVSFLNPGLVVLGGGLAGLGHVLLAEVRSVVYRQSLPLATGNLPIVLSELGELAGVVGAAHLVSEAVLTTPVAS